MIQTDKLDFEKMPDGLIPAIVQDACTLKVLMLGYMNREALDMTIASGNVTFYSRSRQCLWTKGETSGNYLKVKEMYRSIHLFFKFMGDFLCYLERMELEGLLIKI